MTGGLAYYGYSVEVNIIVCLCLCCLFIHLFIFLKDSSLWGSLPGQFKFLCLNSVSD